MILTDREIRQSLSDGQIEIDPLTDPETQIQPASVDLTLATGFVGLAADGRHYQRAVGADRCILGPGDFLLGSTAETVYCAPRIAARVEGRSSWGRLGLAVHVTAGFVDPGFRGQITLEFANLGPAPITLVVGDRVAQIVFEFCASAAERPYGSPGLGSRYQGQTGATVSAITRDGCAR